MDSRGKTYITELLIEEYCQYLREEEKSSATIEKYRRDIQCFHQYICREN